eukprot:7378542-Prymnesium_polylepis.1
MLKNGTVSEEDASEYFQVAFETAGGFDFNHLPEHFPVWLLSYFDLKPGFWCKDSDDLYLAYLTWSILMVTGVGGADLYPRMKVRCGTHGSHGMHVGRERGQSSAREKGQRAVL